MRGPDIEVSFVDEIWYSSCEDIMPHEKHEIMHEVGYLDFICIGRD